MEQYHSNNDETNSPTLGRGRGEVRLKVCGMKHNTSAVADFQTDYLGFIFWKPSKRYFEGEHIEVSHTIKKIGVFVDASLEDILEKVDKYNLWGAQLHGNENRKFCRELKKHLPHLKIIKVFSIESSFDFSILEEFDEIIDFYLFDTKGKLPGGNGYTFNWKVLKNYPSTKPYFLSGGIGLEETKAIQEFLKQPEAKYCHAIDVNSRFEIKPGLKDIEKLKEFKKNLGQE